jgi:hypothetical protein
MVAMSLLILRYVPPPEVSKAVIIQVLPDKGPPLSSVHISPSRPVFAKGNAIFSPILSIFSDASLQTLPGNNGLEDDCSSSASSSGSLLLQDEVDDEPEVNATAAAPDESPAMSSKVALHKSLLYADECYSPLHLMFFCFGQCKCDSLRTLGVVANSPHVIPIVYIFSHASGCVIVILQLLPLL